MVVLLSLSVLFFLSPSLTFQYPLFRLKKKKTANFEVGVCAVGWLLGFRPITSGRSLIQEGQLLNVFTGCQKKRSRSRNSENH